MPQQEVFLDRQVGGHRIQVLKTYDEQFAREAFSAMSASAQDRLWEALDIEASYDTADIPTNEAERSEFLLEELISSGREDGQTFSYFVVTDRSQPVYVSPDWPSAEAYAIGNERPVPAIVRDELTRPKPLANPKP